MRLSEKAYAKILRVNKDHCRWTIDFVTGLFGKIRSWIQIAYPPHDVDLIATIRIYRSKDGSHFIKLGNHSSYTAGYWFEEKNNESI